MHARRAVNARGARGVVGRRPGDAAMLVPLAFFFFFNDTATTEIYTLSLHDALPIYGRLVRVGELRLRRDPVTGHVAETTLDRKSTRLNSSHSQISYAVFCLKKKTTKEPATTTVAFRDISTLASRYLPGTPSTRPPAA